MKTYLKGLITQNSLPPIYHDTALCVTVLTAAWLFRREIRNLVDRIKTHKSKWFGENEFAANELFVRFQKSLAPNLTSPAATETEGSTKTPLDFYKSAHFYWLGSDMETAIRSVITMPNKELTIRALTQALWHFRNSGLKEDDIEQRVRRLISLNENKVLSEWVTEISRKDILNEILVVKTKIDHFVQREAGAKFKPFEN